MTEYDVKYGLYKPTSIIFDRWFGDLQYLSYVWMPEVHTHMHVSPQNAMVFDPHVLCRNLQVVLFYADTISKYRHFPEWKCKEFFVLET